MKHRMYKGLGCRQVLWLVLLLFCSVQIKAQADVESNKDSLVFTNYWQNVYNLISKTSEVSDMLSSRLKLFTTETEKYFGAELPVESQRLFARNLQTFFVASVMENYHQQFGEKEVKSSLNKKEAALTLNDFYRRTDYRSKETKMVYAISAKGILLSFPERFFIAKAAQYVGGIEGAVKYLSEHLVCPVWNESTYRDVTLSIDKEGNAALIELKPNGNEKIYLFSMPGWEPARLTNGEPIASKQTFRVPFTKVEAPKFKEKGGATDYFYEQIPYNDTLDGNYLRLSFMVSKEGKTMEPIEMNMVGIAKEPIPNTDYYQAHEYDVEMSDSLKEIIKRAVLDMPTWEKPAVSESGAKDAIVDIGIRFLKIEVDSTALNTEKMPEFPGGMPALMKWLVQNQRYPAICQENGIQGRVIVQYVVDRDGVILDPYVVKGVDPYLDKEALRVVRMMPIWKPGIQKGKPVRVKYTLPMTFRLNN